MSEALSLSSKLAALHVQYVNDPVVLDAVNDIEMLASDLAGRVWQKIVIRDTIRCRWSSRPSPREWRFLHSVRSATRGSDPVARRAGTHTAIAATAQSTATTMIPVRGSKPETPNS